MYVALVGLTPRRQCRQDVHSNVLPTGISSATYLTDCFATLLSTAASVLLRIPFFVNGVF